MKMRGMQKKTWIVVTFMAAKSTLYSLKSAVNLLIRCVPAMDHRYVYDMHQILGHWCAIYILVV